MRAGTVTPCAPTNCRAQRRARRDAPYLLWADPPEFSQRDCSSETLSLAFTGSRLHDIGMNLILSTHNVTLTKAIEDHIISRTTKLEHLDRFVFDPALTGR